MDCLPKVKKEVNYLDKRKTQTFFILLFPTLLISAISLITMTKESLRLVPIMLMIVVYQFITTKSFIEDYFKNKSN